MLKVFIAIAILLCSFPIYAEKPEFVFAFEDKEGVPAYLGNGHEVPVDNPGIDIEVLRNPRLS